MSCSVPGLRAGGYHGTNVALSPEKSACLRACVSQSKYFTAEHTKFHVRMEPALDDLPTLQTRSLKGTRRVDVESWSNDDAVHQQLPSNSARSFEARLRSQDFELP